MILTYQKMLEVLANYSLNHTDIGMFDLCGLCRTGEKEIYIAKDMSETQKIQTIIHECIHGYKYLHGLRDKEKTTEEEAQKTYARLYKQR